MSINATQFRELVDTALHAIGYHSPEAVELLMLTAAQESGLGTYLRQIKGPARGVFQIEPATHKDLWDRVLKARPELARRICQLCFGSEDRPPWLTLETALWGNLIYGVCMARVFYLSKPGAIPKTTQGQAEYWKKHYNTYLGKGTAEQAVASYNRFCK